MSKLHRLIEKRREGWSLPGEFYTDQDIFDIELRNIWRRTWLFVGHSCEAKKPGDYFTFEMDHDSVILARQDNGDLKALFNTCRHRGSRLVAPGSGLSKSFICPYHQWSYAKDGRCVNFGGTNEGLDREKFSLAEAKVTEVAGLVFLTMHPEPLDFTPVRNAIGPQLKPHGLERAKIAHSEEYVVRANWKLVWENNRECFHCRLGHPEYITANYDTASPDDPAVKAEIASIFEEQRPNWEAQGIPPAVLSSGGVPLFPTPGVWWRSIRTIFRRGFVTQSLDGQPVSRLMGNFTDPNVGNLRVSTLPSLWNHSNCDYSMSTRVTPLSAHETAIRVSWLVHEEAREGQDYSLEKLLPMWKLTGEQDWRLCEVNHAGVRSSRYQPGPYSKEREYNVDQFVSWYLDLLKR